MIMIKSHKNSPNTPTLKSVCYGSALRTLSADIQAFSKGIQKNKTT
ncbi:hypothetical protein FM106_20840 [Brachybacterium faecium]|nr:hypothetical protein FM106_20840 [Brachybacterium faecium]